MVANLTNTSFLKCPFELNGCGGRILYLEQKLDGCNKYSCLTSSKSLLFETISTGILLSAKYFCKTNKNTIYLPKIK